MKTYIQFLATLIFVFLIFNVFAQRSFVEGQHYYPVPKALTAEQSSEFEELVNSESGDAIFGCSDEMACNYNPEATVDIDCCYNNCISLSYQSLLPEVNPFVEGGNLFWTLKEEGGELITSGEYASVELCLSDGCYVLELFDSQPGDLFIASEDQQLVAAELYDESSESIFFHFSIGIDACVYNGCYDIAASNFDPNAKEDDGSCIYATCGFLSAINYDPTSAVGASNGCYSVSYCDNAFDDINGVGADFVGDYAFNKWVSPNGAETDGYVIVSPNRMKISGPNGGESGSQGAFSFASAAGEVAFNFDFLTWDDEMEWDYPVITVNGLGVTYDIISSSPESDSSPYRAQCNVSFFVEAGDLIEIKVTSDDGSFGEGYMVVKDFTFPVLPCCPSDISGDGVADANDLLIFLAGYGQPCPIGIVID